MFDLVKTNRKEILYWILLFAGSFFVVSSFIWFMLDLAYTADAKRIKERGRDTLAHLQYVVPRLAPDNLQEYIQSVYREPETFSYLLVMDKHGLAIAHSNPDRKGMTFYEDGLKQVVANGRVVEQIYIRDADNPASPFHGEKTVDILAPYYALGGRLEGVVNIGISLKVIDQLHNEYLQVTLLGVAVSTVLIFIFPLMRIQYLNAQKRADVIRASRANQSILLDNIRTQVWYLTDDHTYGAINRAHAEFNGAKVQDLAFRDMYDIIPKNVVEVYREGNIKVFTTGRTVRAEKWVPNASGERRLLSIVKSPKVGSYGNIEYVVCSAEDITDRERAEEVLRESEKKYRQLFETAMVGIYRTKIEDGKFLAANESLAKMMGYESVDTFIDEYVTSEHYAEPKRREELMDRLQRFGKVDGYEIEMIRMDGTRIFIALSATIYPDLGFTEGAIIDITKRKLMEKSVADSEQRLSDIIEFLPDPTWVIDTDGRVVAWNRAMQGLTGINEEQIIGKGDYAYAVPLYGEPRPVLIDLVLKRDGQWEKEYLSLKDESGQLVSSVSFHPSMGNGGRYLAATAAKLYNAMGDVIGAIESIRDITDTKQSEQEHERLIVELRDALDNVQTLSGLLPICSSCKKIRDDKGYWNQIESYIHKHSEAEFSHGICPECMDKIYGEQDWYQKRNKE